MWEKVAMSCVTEVEGWRKNKREETLLGAFYVLIMLTPCFTLCSVVGLALCGDSKGKKTSQKTGCLDSSQPCTKESSEE